MSNILHKFVHYYSVKLVIICVVTVCSTDLYLVNEGIVTPDLFITVNNLSMELTVTLHNDTNMSQVASGDLE